MRAKSQASFEAASERWETLIASTTGSLLSMALDMVAIVDALAENSQLRRVMTDPAGDGERKAALVDQLFGGKVHPDVVDFVTGVARAHWSADEDFLDVIRRHATIAVLADAEKQGILAEVADELFAVEQFLSSQRELRDAFGDKLQSAENRVDLVNNAFQGKVKEHTLMILRRIVTVQHHRGGLITELRLRTRLAAERRDRMVAVVTAALPPTSAQLARIEKLLSERYGRQVQIHVRVDPEIVGGLRIVVGDYAVDGTISSRLTDLQRTLAD